MTPSGLKQDTIYCDVIESREGKTLKPNFLVLATAPDGRIVSFDAATRLAAMNQILFYEKKMNYTDVYVYRLGKDNQYSYDSESQLLAYQPRIKKEELVEQKPLIKSGVDKKSAKTALRTFEAQVHAFMVNGDFSYEVRKEFVEYIVTAYVATGGGAEELIAEVENVIGSQMDDVEVVDAE